MTAAPALALFAVFGLALFGLTRGGGNRDRAQLEAIVRRARAGSATADELWRGAELARSLGLGAVAEQLEALAAAHDGQAAGAAPISAEDVEDVAPVTILPPGRSRPSGPIAAPVTEPEVSLSAPPDDAPSPAAPTPPPSDPALMPAMASPLPEATDDQWARFVRTMGTGKVNTVTRSYNLGIFRQGMPTLEALGVVTNVRKGRVMARGGYDGKHDVWIGDWIPPLTLAQFLSDPALQYRLFERNVVALRELLLSRHGADLDAAAGERGSLSGLLAVALVAGPRGFAKWWAEGGGTNATTDHAFRVADGIF